MTDTIIDQLSAPFALGQHEYRKQGKGDDITGYLTYVGIEHAIARLNDVLGSAWSWTVISHQIGGESTKPSVIVHGRISYTDANGHQQHRDGLGAAQWQSQADDLDKIVKSAMAEAFKKASHQFGMAGYLWDKGLADQIAVELLKQEGKGWGAKYRPKQPRKGSTAEATLQAIRQPLPATPPSAPDDLITAANEARKSLGLDGNAGKACLEDFIRRQTGGRTDRPSQLTTDEVTSLTAVLRRNPKQLIPQELAPAN